MIENYQLYKKYMGLNTSYVTVATLNYSGILNSPFEFYASGTQTANDERQLSKTFKEILVKEIQNFNMQNFEWQLGKIDRQMQKQRYSPLYRQDCGVINNKLLSVAEFQEEWEKQFAKNQGVMKSNFTPEQKKSAKLFDTICYKSIVFYANNVSDFSQLNRRITTDYVKLMNKFFNKSFLRQKDKITKIHNFIQTNKIDILFLQEASPAFIQSMKKNQYFEIISSQKQMSLIILKKSIFTKIHDQKSIISALGEDFKKKCFNWNNDTAVAFADNVVMISGHLSSKAEKNQEQIKKMIESIENIKTIYPYYRVIVGCDTNSFLEKVPKGFMSYPDKSSLYTTSKRRTMLQPQVAKAQFDIKQCKDHLITDIQLINPRVMTIQGKQTSTLEYIPCSLHPYDHFVVVGQIDPTKLKQI